MVFVHEYQIGKAEKDAEYKLLNRAFDDLFPICRSITGLGIESSLNYFKNLMPLTIEQVKSGTTVFDWVTPASWLFKRARLWGPNGNLICDTEVNNLHVINYSEPVDREIDFADLRPHLYSIPHLPDAIPYVTSYYKRTWGFCLAHNILKSLPQGKYKVRIESSFDDEGGVPFGQCSLAGESKKEILLTSYLCHPSMANNELSGPLVLLGLYNRIKHWPKRRFTYRFVLNPETIGSLCYLYKYGDALKENLEAGLILTCLGGPKSKLRYKKSKRNDSLFDKLVSGASNEGWDFIDFTPLSGSDERQFCAPGFNLPMGQASRNSYGEYEGYHNSLDTKEYMSIDSLIRSIDEIEKLLIKAEYGAKVINLCPYGEPQLGKRGLYPTMNSYQHTQGSSDNALDSRQELNSILTILSEATGDVDMLDNTEKIGIDLVHLMPIIDKLEGHQLIQFNSSRVL